MVWKVRLHTCMGSLATVAASNPSLRLHGTPLALRSRQLGSTLSASPLWLVPRGVLQGYRSPCRTQVQVSQGAGVGYLALLRGAVAEGGLRGLYRGYNVALVRDCIGYGLGFAGYEVGRQAGKLPP